MQTSDSYHFPTKLLTTSFVCLFLSLPVTALAAEPVLHVEPQQRQLMEDVSISSSGAIPGGKVVIEATFKDDDGLSWSSRGVYYADQNGEIDVSRTASIAGTYTGVDTDGLFWSMLPVAVDQLSTHTKADREKEAWPSFPNFKSHKPVDIAVSATMEMTSSTFETRTATVGHRIVIMGQGVTRQDIAVDEIRGVLFTPSGDGPHPVVVFITGSGGGVSEDEAVILATHGFASLALAHFNYPGRPDQLANVPLEYFRDVIDWMRTEFKQEKVGLIGGSRGGEAVLLIASAFPERISAVVAQVPSNVVWGGCCSVEASILPAWTLGGEPVVSAKLDPAAAELFSNANTQPIEYRQSMLSGMQASDDADPAAIRVENIRAPILLISGDADSVWASAIASEKIIARLKRHNFKYSVNHLSYSGVGHFVGHAALVTSLADAVMHPVTKTVIGLGGVPAQIAPATKDAHAKTLMFMKTHVASNK